MTNFNRQVSEFLDDLQHPLRREIEELRRIILNAGQEISENIKWNGPNYSIGDQDRVTMKIQPPKQIQLIFHRGAKKLAQPKERLINDTSELLSWKENDRAIATFRNINEIHKHRATLDDIVKKWIAVQ